MWAVVLYRAQVRCVGVDGYVENPWPALKGGDDKEREHRLHDVVVVEGTSNPLASLHDRLVDVPVRVGDELPLARAVVVH